MKWSFVIQQKLKAAVLLGSIMVLIILGSVLSRYNVHGIDQSVSSIYKDRLIPATTIIYLTENLYGKRLTLEKHLFLPDPKSEDELRSQLKTYDTHIDSLVGVFEKTYLVDQETKSLQKFKYQVDKYRLLEATILNLTSLGANEEGKLVFAKTGAAAFQESIHILNELTSIQSDIGADLMKVSKSEAASFDIISFLQIGLSVIIGLIVLILIQNDRIINKPEITANKKQQYFNLN
ncbi:MCP four helix bundle domain-containing protein [Dyadobacter sp. CY323]|uniref:MCP four helix bundle domain-containing protein n=1 Tax=Dyadobacter sp. CY323 TaxID=2907302 RepID=UPI001F24ADC9|nr:MCP four helix bundle domain-containing protein [Dyadobacter sp. CY323]MCE6989899.1 MCP four helix bundle domain-containing protein [Dyadobacter sp. CY323]